MTSQEANSIPLGDILSHYGYEPSRRYGGYDLRGLGPVGEGGTPGVAVDFPELQGFQGGEPLV